MPAPRPIPYASVCVCVCATETIWDKLLHIKFVFFLYSRTALFVFSFAIINLPTAAVAAAAAVAAIIR